MFHDRWLWTGVGLFVMGRIIDLGWHATHPEFETAGDQVRAHAVVWIGVIVLIAASLRRLAADRRHRGDAVLLIGSTMYAGVAVWHFWEHSRFRDPELAHVLLVVATLVMLAAVVWITVAARRRSAAA